MTNISKSDCLVLIPAYNEAEKIGSVVRQVIDGGFPALVVDDGSTDSTAVMLKDLPVSVLTFQTNRGKGASLRKGFEWLLNKNYSAVILMDADGQHDPAELGLFLDALRQNKWDFVIGSRLENPDGMPLVRVWTNRLMSWVISVISGQKIVDSQCGYRAIKREVLKNLPLSTTHFEIESEMLLMAARRGFKIGSVPIRCIYENKKSRIRPVTDTIRFLKFIFRYVFSKEKTGST